MPFQDSTNLNNISKYIVDGNGDTPYTTIQSAIDAANASGDVSLIYVRPNGTQYTENLTLYDDIVIMGAGIESIILGVHTPPASGAVSFYNLHIVSGTDIITSAVAGTTRLRFFDCVLNCTNGYVVDCANWDGPIDILQCTTTSTIDGVARVDASTITIVDSDVGAGATAMTFTAGTLEIRNSRINNPITTAGASTVTATMGSSFGNTVTIGGTTTATFTNSTFSTGANQALTQSSANDITLSDVTIDTTNPPAIGGAGAGNLNIGSITFLNEPGIAGTVTKVYGSRFETSVLKLDDADQGAIRVNAGLVTSIQGQNIVYVGKHGLDTNDGLVWENAFLTIQAAVTVASAGTTILVDPGIYTETITHVADDVIVFARGDHGNCIIRQADANVIDFNTRTGILYKFFTIECTAATTAINTTTGSTGTCVFKDCDIRMITAADLAQVDQPGIGELTGAGTLEFQLGEMDYLHTGNGGGTAQKAAFTVANGGMIIFHGIETININNSGTALVSALAIDLATTGNIQIHHCTVDITDPNATIVAGLAYVGGAGLLHEFYRNDIHVTVVNNTGYGFFAADTATTSRFLYNHIHVEDTAGLSYAYYVGNTSTVLAHFDDLIAADGNVIVGTGSFISVNSASDGNLTATNNVNATTFDTNVAAAAVTLAGTTLAADGTDANIPITITPKGTEAVTIDGLDYPMADGNAGECMITSGAGVLSLGVLTVPGGGSGAATFTDHGVLVGSGAGVITALGVGTNGQVLVGSTGADPVFATLASADSSITYALGAGTLGLTVTQAGEAQLGGAQIATAVETVAYALDTVMITPSKLGSAFATPAAIGTGTPAAATFTTLTGDAFDCDSCVVDPGASGDSYIRFDINTAAEWCFGVDDDDGDNLKITQGGASPSAGTETWEMTPAGELRLPLQPAFLAYNSVTDDNVTGDNTKYTVIFDTEVFDQNSDYNNGTGTFTAPITGRYQFNTSVLLEQAGAATVFELYITASNREFRHIDQFTMAGTLQSVQLSALIDMDAADTVIVEVLAGGIGADTADVHGSATSITSFGGFLSC